MELSSSILTKQLPGLSILQSANRQPELAGELIDRTMEGLRKLQPVPTTPKTAATPTMESATGQVINIYA